MKYKAWWLCSVLAFAWLAGCQTSERLKFQNADTDGDGLLSRKEATTAMVKAIFKQYDSNGNGQVTADEWKSWHGDDMKIFKERDSNRDGIVTLGEALAHALKHGTFDKQFDFADSNKDGFINRDEARAFSARYYEEVR